MRKIIYYVATSADGFIARKDGDVDWLNRPEPPGGYGMKAFYRSVDTVLLGHKTWEVGRKLGQSLFPGVKNYVFSRRRKTSPHPEIELVKDDIRRFSRRLRREKGKDIWLVGGARLAGSFLDAGEVDEVISYVIPVFIGDGLPLFAARHRSLPLELIGTRKYSDGVVRLHYTVTRARPRGARARKTPRSR